ncbi:MAG: hypothetical protein Q8O93_01400 [bacterium]|nr:hypothetical protein [bacterium]
MMYRIRTLQINKDRTINVEFSDGIAEYLKSCPLCDAYHGASVIVCPETGENIEQERERRAERTKKLIQAEAAREKYRRAHEQRWRSFLIIPGSFFVFFIALNMVFSLKPNIFLVIFVSSIIAVLWFMFWDWVDSKYYYRVDRQAEREYQLVLEGGEKPEEAPAS